MKELVVSLLIASGSEGRETVVIERRTPRHWNWYQSYLEPPEGQLLNTEKPFFPQKSFTKNSFMSRTKCVSAVCLPA